MRLTSDYDALDVANKVRVLGCIKARVPVWDVVPNAVVVLTDRVHLKFLLSFVCTLVVVALISLSLKSYLCVMVRSATICSYATYIFERERENCEEGERQTWPTEESFFYK